jgi:hypothetical protein
MFIAAVLSHPAGALIDAVTLRVCILALESLQAEDSCSKGFIEHS